MVTLKLVAGAPRCKCKPRCTHSVQFWDVELERTLCEAQARALRTEITHILRPASKARIEGRAFTYRHFSEKEVAIILKMYGEHSLQDIANRLDRTRHSIKNKVKELRKEGKLPAWTLPTQTTTK